MKYQLILLSFLFILSNPSFAQDRYPSLEFYPEKYDAYGIEAWDTIRSELDKILDCKSINLKVADSPNFLWNTRYFFPRITDIPWNQSQKDEIVSYLEYFVIIMNRNADKYSKIFNRYNQKRPLFSYPTIAIWTILKLDVGEGLRVIDKLAQNSSASISISLISPYYKHKDFAATLEKAIKDKQLTEKDTERIYELRFEHQLSKIKSQKKAWKKIIVKNQLSELDLTDNKANVWYWYNVIKLMKDIHEEIDINIVLSLIKKMDTFGQKYSLLYVAGASINGKLSRSENVELKIVNRFLNVVEKLCINQDEFNLLDVDNTDTVPRLYGKIKDHLSTPELSK